MQKELHVALEGAQGWYEMYALRLVQIRDSGKWKWSLCYHKSGGDIASLYAYHSEAQMVVPIWRNNEIDEVAQGRETW
jgi:hypothetical protein